MPLWMQQSSKTRVRAAKGTDLATMVPLAMATALSMLCSAVLLSAPLGTVPYYAFVLAASVTYVCESSKRYRPGYNGALGHGNCPIHAVLRCADISILGQQHLQLL